MVASQIAVAGTGRFHGSAKATRIALRLRGEGEHPRGIARRVHKAPWAVAASRSQLAEAAASAAQRRGMGVSEAESRDKRNRRAWQVPAAGGWVITGDLLLRPQRILEHRRRPTPGRATADEMAEVAVGVRGVLRA